MDSILSSHNNNPHSLRCEEVYEMEEIIGSGTFSDVVRGKHGKEGGKYAIKIIDKAKLQTPKQRERLQNEVSLHKRCNHTNIVTFQDVYESELDICIVMELCEGGELFNRIVEKGHFSEKEASHILKQILSAIQYLHSLGIVHRDIKPENLLFVSRDEYSEIKLADFGLAKQIDVHPVSGRAMLKASTSGTTAYCAPERLGQIQESKAVDMWSIGCIMYFLLFGVPPFYSTKEDEEEYEDEIHEAIMEGNVSFDGKRPISTPGKDLIMRLLEKDPSHRITASQALLHPWIKNSSYSSMDEQEGTDTADSALMLDQGKERASALKSSINFVIDMCSLKEGSKEQV